ncbi:MAG: hypothetical protein LBK83_10760 [Treponema sp.]|nr:hypothetical protein [Treponema sp.]
MTLRPVASQFRFVFFFVLASGVYGLDFSGAELGFSVTPEYNRAFNQCWTFSGSGSLSFNERYTVKSGLSFWAARDVYEVDTFISGEAVFPLRLPLSGGVSYVFNGMPDYDTGSHTLLPLISLKGRRAGISVGPALRFNSFYYTRTVFESILAVSAYVNFYNTEKFRIGLRCANFGDFAVGNFGSYFLNLNSSLKLTKLFSLINELELYQSGSSGLSANFFGVAYRGGLTVSWR